MTHTLTPGAGDEPNWPPGWQDTRNAEQRRTAEQRERELALFPDHPVQPPSVGRIAHYVADSTSGCLAALITNVRDGRVQLVVFEPLPDRVVNNSEYDSGNRPGTWHWPERV